MPPVLFHGIEPLRELAAKNFITSEVRLLQLARRKGLPVTPEMAKRALNGNVAKQVFARAPRSEGQAAAEQPGSRIQIDLADLSKNSRSGGYFELATDVFTRKSYAVVLQHKDAAGVKAATEKILEEIPGHGHGATVSTDQGKEFADFDEIEGIIHRTKCRRGHYKQARIRLAAAPGLSRGSPQRQPVLWRPRRP